MVAGRLRSSSPRSFAAVRLEAARGGGGGPAPDRGSACKLSSGGSFAKPGCAPGSRRALSESHARGGGAGGRGVNGAPESSHTWPCGLMDKALVFGSKDCRPESCQGHACAFVGPAACPRHAARCHLGPRQRAGARRGGGGAVRATRSDTPSKRVGRAGHRRPAPTKGQEAPSERDAPDLTRRPLVGLRGFMKKSRTKDALAPREEGPAQRDDPPRTRTWNLRLRRPTPYPLGQQAT